MNNSIYKLLYCSRNHIEGSSAQVGDAIRNILGSSRRNNARAGVTGALLFNEGLFAQVLEGPMEAVERIFETIQRDRRHSDVTVLQMGPTETRDFPEWSMAFASANAESDLRASIPSLGDAISNPSLAGEQILSLLHELVVQEDCMLA